MVKFAHQYYATRLTVLHAQAALVRLVRLHMVQIGAIAHQRNTGLARLVLRKALIMKIARLEELVNV